ncbi:hypothetical protein I6N90_13385 [Paenibacillus sp. GSMTC-2017]|uniref:hypothetical protein n=1 Tax=Paenibacillus sp. GSMTC-2017 TaxID=2794350 RepID=UPI0018D6D004|nr:hypothetical protein [Paenibacillus sp. GSMTC-2017]MBH5318794.1 hypothetical protein [Paenibacillus sp. GSMTC-2017]
MGNVIKPETKLSQWDALQLESLKAYGWSNEEIIRNVYASKLPKDESKFQFNYSGLSELARDHADTFERAVNDGYQIKYNTIRGIHSWILIALQLDAELVLDPGKEAVIVSLTETETFSLSSVLSFGWALQAIDGRIGDRENSIAYVVKPIGQ